jgi:hypothetical protein
VVYALLDLCHSSSKRIGLVFLTQSIAAVDHMEKRVASRFSQLCIHFPRLLARNEQLIQAIITSAWSLAISESVENKWNSTTQQLAAGASQLEVRRSFYYLQSIFVFFFQC